jgi:hypothetical protein
MDKESANWIANKYDGMEAQRLFYDSFNISGRNKVLDLYNTQDKQKYIEKAAITEVQNLIRTLNLTNCTVVVNIIK